MQVLDLFPRKIKAKIKALFKQPPSSSQPFLTTPSVTGAEPRPSADALDSLLRHIAADPSPEHQKEMLLTLIARYHGDGSYFFELLEWLKRMRYQGGCSQQIANQLHQCVATLLDDHWQVNLCGGIYVRERALFGVPALVGLPSATLEKIDSLKAFDVLAGDVAYGRYYRNQGMVFLLSSLNQLLSTPVTEWRWGSCSEGCGTCTDEALYHNIANILEKERYLDQWGTCDAVFSIHSVWFYLNSFLLKQASLYNLRKNTALLKWEKKAYIYCERYLQIFMESLEKEQSFWMYDYYATRGDGRFTEWIKNRQNYKSFYAILILQCYDLYLQGASETALCRWVSVLPWLSIAKTTDEERYVAACFYIARLLLLLQMLEDLCSVQQDQLESDASPVECGSFSKQIETIQQLLGKSSPLIGGGENAVRCRRLLGLLSRLKAVLLGSENLKKGETRKDSESQSEKKEKVGALCRDLFQSIAKPAHFVFNEEKKWLIEELEALQLYYKEVSCKRLNEACFYNAPRALEIFFEKTWRAAGVFRASRTSIESALELEAALLSIEKIAQQQALPLGTLGFIFHAYTLYAFYLFIREYNRQESDEEKKLQQREGAAHMLRQAYIEILKAIVLIPHSTVILHNYYGVQRSEYLPATIYTRCTFFHKDSTLETVAAFLRKRTQALQDPRLSHLATIEAEVAYWYKDLTGERPSIGREARP